MPNIVTLPITYVDGQILTASDLNSNLTTLNTATIPVTNGGTGLASGTSGGVPYFSATTTIGSSGLLTQYGVIYGGGAGAAPVATAVGTTGQALVAATGAAPAFATLPVAGGGTNITSYTAGDTLYASGATTLTKLAKGTAAQVLTMNAGATAPEWSTPSSFTPVAGVAERTAGDVTTTSTSLVDLTGASITITTGARRVLLGITSEWENNTNTARNCYTWDVDGTNQAGTADWLHQFDTAGRQLLTSTWLTDVLTAASHTFKFRWRVTAGTGTVTASTGSKYRMYAIEQNITA